MSGSQVSPIEIEEVLLAHPQKLVADVTVAGVRGGGRTADERVPRAWVVLSESGKRAGATGVTKELERWHQTNLSKYKWLRGGIEIVQEVQLSPLSCGVKVLTTMSDSEVSDGKDTAPTVAGSI